MAEKKLQHARLCEILSSEGHKVEFLPIILGAYGSVSTCLPKALSALGVPLKEQVKLQNRLVEHACLCHDKILKQRRYLESLKKPPDK